MWSKLTSHIGLWLTHMDRDHDDTRKTQLRESCSLSVLNQRHLSIVKNFKSSDNLHRVVLHVTPPTTRKPTIFFNLRKSRKREKYSKKDERAKENDNTDKGKFGIYKKHPDKVQIRNDNNSPLQAVLSNLKNDDMAQSWQSSNLSSSKSLFNLFRTTRSRSGTNNCIVSACPDPCCSSSTSDPRSTLSSMEEKRSSSVIRRRRPRSAHLDPNTLVFPPREMPVQDISELYRRIEKLGEGSYAVVYKCESRSDGNIVALKEIKIHNQEGLPFTAIREASLLRALRHSNIVTLHDIVHEQNSLVFVFEYMKTDLSKYLEQHRTGLEQMQVRLFLFQLLRGLAFCHSKKILHRDLKPQNLLLNGNGELKLADFGLARAKSVPSRTYSHEVVTLWYRPPDVLLGSTDYSTSLDLWGVGCIFAEMCTGEALFQGVTNNVTDQLDRIFSIRGIPDPKKWPEVLKLPHYSPNFHPPYQELDWSEIDKSLARLKNGQSLLSNFLQLNPTDRISANGAMMHPYFGCFPSSIHLLPPTASIYSLPKIRSLQYLFLTL
uniref:cyclin-dependent kinase n=2 Tax=Wuchereria bancrofti TaxID=6293 RepID=A0AAF5RX45_WUCBA